jgi:hypothetical protein
VAAMPYSQYNQFACSTMSGTAACMVASLLMNIYCGWGAYRQDQQGGARAVVHAGKAKVAVTPWPRGVTRPRVVPIAPAPLPPSPTYRSG